MPTIFTTGYARLREPALLGLYAVELDAIVVDVRLSPWTRFNGWARRDLEARLGERYRWVEAFGNVNYREQGRPRLKDPEAGVQQVAPLLEHHNVILLCGCADPLTCHRHVVAETLSSATNCPVTDLPLEDDHSVLAGG